jgi:Poly(hydroxyalcanoate) granule associated protein (phasin)
VSSSDATIPEKEKERRLPELFRDAWTQALSAVSSAEEEAQRALGRVWSPDDVRKHAQAFAEKLVGQRKEVEKSIDAGVKRTLARSKLPRREEVEALRARASALAARLDALAQKRRSAR